MNIPCLCGDRFVICIILRLLKQNLKYAFELVLHDYEPNLSCMFVTHLLLMFQVKLSTENVIQRNLVTEELNVKDIVKEHASYCDVEREIKHFQGTTLGYVTPVSFQQNIAKQQYIYVYILRMR